MNLYIVCILIAVGFTVALLSILTGYDGVKGQRPIAGMLQILVGIFALGSVLFLAATLLPLAIGT